MKTVDRFTWTANDIEVVSSGRKYAEDQPRDDHGRFATAEGTSGILDVPSRLEDLTPEGRAVWTGIMAHYGVTVAELRDTIASRISPEAIAHAKGWYPEVNALVSDTSDKTGIPEDRIAAAFAACSPKCEWENQTTGEGETKYIPSMAQFVADGKADGLTPQEAILEWKADYKENNDVLTQAGEPRGASLMNTTGSRGMAVLMGESDPNDVLSDNKTRSFFDNIMQPGQTNEVTIDTHMAKSLELSYGVSHDDALDFVKETGGRSNPDSRVEGAGYIAISEAVREVASRYDEPPDVIQAAFWEQVLNVPVIPPENGSDWPSGLARSEPKK
jgi:hypothetical protein